MKPILFNTEMVRAILEGRKTVTRRVLKQPFEIHPNGYITKQRGSERLCPYEPPYQVNDILYVRETWHKYTKRVGKGEQCHLQEFYGYRASIANWEDANEPWKPSIHMPKEAARIFLRVTGVRVERLQDITEKQAEKEGCVDDVEYCVGNTARGHFEELWDSTLGRKGTPEYYCNCWKGNPYVWVIEFERLECGSMADALKQLGA